VRKCPKKYRLIQYFGECIVDEREFVLEEVEDDDHNHNVEPEKEWGLTPSQKMIVTDCLNRKAGAPFKVCYKTAPSIQGIFLVAIHWALLWC
jgi:hypothetical protein